MATAADYTITTPYGQVPGYPLNGGFHRGEDRAMPVGTTVIVNGVTIGLSGNTGASTGPHLHIGRWVNGNVTAPSGGGFKFASAVVASTGEDSVNGKFIRVNADGAQWVYLHLSSINVKTGQVLQGGSSNVSTIGEVEFNHLFTGFFGPISSANPVTEADRKRWIGAESNTVIRQMYSDPRQQAYANRPTTGGEYIPVGQLYVKK